MANQALAVQITAVDRFSAALSKFRDDLERSGVPVEKLGKAARKLEPGAGLAGMGKAFGDIATRARGAADELGRVVPPLAAITGAASLAGMAKLVASFGDWGTRLGNQAARVGVAAGDLQTFQNAARLAGVSGEAAGQGLQALTDNLRDAAGGRNPAMLGWIREFSQFDPAIGRMFQRGASASEMLPHLANQIAALKNPADQARVAIALFGGAGEQMLPFLRRGAAGMRELEDTAKRYGVTNAAGVRAADQFRMSQVRLQLAVEGLTNTVGERLAPVLTPLLDQLAAWTASKGPAVAEALGRIAEQFSAWVKDGGLDRTIAKLEGVASAVNGVVGALGGWDRVAEVAFGVMAVRRLAGFARALAGARAEVALLKLGISAIAADQAVSALDPKDRFGSWVDRNVPGASWFDDFMARATGLGRTYQEQREADPSSRANASGALPSGTADQALPVEARGLLDTIAGTESPGYDVMYGGQRFADFSHHPGLGHTIASGPNAGQSSSAAGRYQFLERTWDTAAAATGAKDFSPESQDKGAWWLAQRDYQSRTGRDLLRDLQSGDPAVRAQIGAALRQTWTSLPGGIEQGTTRDRFAEQLAANTVRERDRAMPGSAFGAAVPAPAAPPITVPAPAAAAGAPGAQGRVDVRIMHSGAPAGTRMTASADGDVSLSAGGLVDQAFPLLGGLY